MRLPRDARDYGPQLISSRRSNVARRLRVCAGWRHLSSLDNYHCRPSVLQRGIDHAPGSGLIWLMSVCGGYGVGMHIWRYGNNGVDMIIVELLLGI
jgi:hypothetical protein